jgi:hypothetical protein
MRIAAFSTRSFRPRPSSARARCTTASSPTRSCTPGHHRLPRDAAYRRSARGGRPRAQQAARESVERCHRIARRAADAREVAQPGTIRRGATTSRSASERAASVMSPRVVHATGAPGPAVHMLSRSPPGTSARRRHVSLATRTDRAWCFACTTASTIRDCAALPDRLRTCLRSPPSLQSSGGRCGFVTRARTPRYERGAPLTSSTALCPRWALPAPILRFPQGDRSTHAPGPLIAGASQLRQRVISRRWSRRGGPADRGTAAFVALREEPGLRRHDREWLVGRR